MEPTYYKSMARYYLSMASKYPEAGYLYEVRSWEFLFLMAEAEGESDEQG